MTAFLIVDDHKMIQEGVAAILQSQGFTEEHGFKLIFAEDKPSALKAYDANKAEISLILTDLNYPGGGGLQFIKDIRARDPAVPIIMMTTDLRDVEGFAEAVPEFRGVPALAKVNLAGELVATIKKQLAGRPGFENGVSFGTPGHG